MPTNKTQARFMYGNGTGGRLPNTKIPKKLSKVQSKIKDQVAYFKSLQKD